MEWTKFKPVRYGVGPDGVCDETHRIQYLGENGCWTACNEPKWFSSGEYRYRLRTPDLTQLSDADLDAQAAAIEAERKRRDDDLGEWLELLAAMNEATHCPEQAQKLRAGVIDFRDQCAAKWLRDHTRRAVAEALAKARKAGDIAMGDQV